MKRLIVEMADADMHALEKVARHLARDPAELLREQVKIFVTAERKGARIQSLSDKEGAVTVPAHKSGIGRNSPMLLNTSAPEPAGDSDQDAARERRLQILRRTSGLMKNDPNFPKDGLQYQAEVRAEWD